MCEITPVLVGIVIVLLAIGFCAGYLVPKETGTVNATLSLSQKDLNILGNLSYLSGHCERLGLASSVYVQQDQNGNAYGVPICVQPAQ